MARRTLDRLLASKNPLPGGNSRTLGAVSRCPGETPFACVLRYGLSLVSAHAAQRGRIGLMDTPFWKEFSEGLMCCFTLQLNRLADLSAICRPCLLHDLLTARDAWLKKQCPAYIELLEGPAAQCLSVYPPPFSQFSSWRPLVHYLGRPLLPLEYSHNNWTKKGADHMVQKPEMSRSPPHKYSLKYL